MTTDAEIDVAARAIRQVFAVRVVGAGEVPTSWDDLKEWQRVGYRDEAKAALNAAEQERAAERIRNCTHQNSLGSGMLGYDGSSRMRWCCRDCGKAWESSTAAREPAFACQSGLVGIGR